MLDKGFFSILVRELPMQYRKYIFAPKSGMGAKNVFGKAYPPYSSKYGIAKKTGQISLQAESYAGSRSPVLSGALLNDFTAAQGLLSDGMGFGNITEMGKVKSLERQGRAISTESRPLPKPVEKWIMAEADKYAKKQWAKNKGRTFNI